MFALGLGSLGLLITMLCFTLPHISEPRPGCLHVACRQRGNRSGSRFGRGWSYERVKQHEQSASASTGGPVLFHVFVVAPRLASPWMRELGYRIPRLHSPVSSRRFPEIFGEKLSRHRGRPFSPVCSRYIYIYIYVYIYICMCIYIYIYA